MKRRIDHIVYCVPDLETAIDHFENLLGILPSIGGAHPTRGTKNALLNLGNQCYLEILAIDEKNVSFSGKRWMGIDLLRGSKITRWSLKSEDLKKDSEILKRYSSDLSQISGGSRMTGNGNLLSWEMIVPAPSPEVELMPFLTDWSNWKAHPTDSLLEGCYLEKVILYHPRPHDVEPYLSELGVDIVICQDLEIRIEVVIKSPTGVHCIC